MYFSIEKLVDYTGNRYELAVACMQYARKVRMLETDEYHAVGEKDALVAIKALLDGKIKYTMDETDTEDDDFDEEMLETRPKLKEEIPE